MTNRLRLTAVVGLAAATVLAGCHSTTTASSPPAAPSTTPASAPSTAASAVDPSASAPSAPAASGAGTDVGAGPLSSAHIRIANFYGPKDQPGPGLDIYDVPLQGAAATPILTNVTYGTVSSYVQPHQQVNSINKAVILYALPTGESPVTQHDDSSQIGGVLDDGSGAQATIMLTADDDDALSSGTSLIGVLSDSMQMEKGDDGQGSKGPAAPPITDGSGEFLVTTNALPINLNTGRYLMIDKSCTPPLNGDPNEKGLPLIFNAATSTLKSNFALFATTPGTHQVSVVNWATSNEPTCKQLTALQSTTSVTVAANQQVEIYVYGFTGKALHLAIAPVQP